MIHKFVKEEKRKYINHTNLEFWQQQNEPKQSKKTGKNMSSQHSSQLTKICFFFFHHMCKERLVWVYKVAFIFKMKKDSHSSIENQESQ